MKLSHDKPLDEDVDVKAPARDAPEFNEADLANLISVAAIKAAVEGADKLSATQLLTAYHESGHAIVALNIDGAHSIHKATIMSSRIGNGDSTPFK
ncbi:hypothetical protein QVD17_35621 [Tagetes erecta]|uniref:Peptidase M41 domain-containing protein n=1 Tax=Tagetes erecta TaxID=13708 RepID=A0AAD8NIA5_TARER|nr:hypothetical protein QVD17_35621 [Tagetes erecta]